ncbi:hypothetical protein GF407_16385 [candidate division KSB1 bacterium]|nr:hypothetical protein [candidate division KSB1 bacterium]
MFLKNINKILLCSMVLLPTLLLAQREMLEVGRLWETLGGSRHPSGFREKYLRWPGGHEDNPRVKSGWRTNSSGVYFEVLIKDYRDYFDDEYAFYQPHEPIDCIILPDYEVTKYVRAHKTGVTVVDPAGNEQSTVVDELDYNFRLQTDILADEQIVKWGFSSAGIITKSTWYAWANPNHKDYVIRVVKLYNTGNTDCDPDDPEEEEAKRIRNIFVGYYSMILHPCGKGDGNVSYDDTGTLDGYIDYYGDEPEDTLRVMYGYDGDDPEVPGDDRGDPFPERFDDDDSQDPKDLYDAGELISAAYAGYGILHAPETGEETINGFSQPFTTGRGDWSTAAGWLKEDKYIYIFNNGEKKQMPPADESQQPVRNMQSAWMGMGPYTMEPYDSLTFVFVHAVSGPTTAKCKEIGRKWLDGEISDAEKNAFIAGSRDSLLNVVGRAKWNWENRLSKGLSIPMSPLPPSNLKIESRKRKIVLTWDPSPSLHTATYRVYRKQGDYHGDMEIIAEIPATQTSYEDEDINLGVAYFYSITAASDGSENDDPNAFGQPLESSPFYNRSTYPARAYRGSLANLESVRVVPNPFNLAQASKWPGEWDRITFTNLTTHCTIRIFSTAGDLIKTLEHNDDSAYEHWSPILTDENLFPSAGLYVYHIQDEESGETTTGKFVIVR